MKCCAMATSIASPRYSQRIASFSPRSYTRRNGAASSLNVFNESFRYEKEVVTPQHAVLEFACEVDGILINGVDIMTFDSEGKIVEFKVMLRPLKAVNLMHAKMQSMLEQLSAK